MNSLKITGATIDSASDMGEGPIRLGITVGRGKTRIVIDCDSDLEPGVTVEECKPNDGDLGDKLIDVNVDRAIFVGADGDDCEIYAVNSQSFMLSCDNDDGKACHLELSRKHCAELAVIFKHYAETGKLR